MGRVMVYGKLIANLAGGYTIDYGITGSVK